MNINKENETVVSVYRSLEVDGNESIINNDDYPEVNISDPNYSGINNINVEYSKDVVIGNVNQFHGPVTIIQNNKNELENENEQQETSDPNEAKSITSETTKKSPSTNINGSKLTFQNNPYIHTKIIILLIFLCISLILGLYLYERSTRTKNSSATGQHKTITRTEWGGRNPIYVRKLHHPTLYVIISHTVTEQCKTIKVCSNIVHNIQNHHIAEYQSPDIGYNFLIGGDENIYEGRGWDAENFHMVPNSIGISFIGNYVYDRLTIGMIEVTQLLLNEGIKQGKLDKNYKLIAHNQTYNTLSPGTNVYDAIKYWPHYSSEIVEIKR